MVSAARPADRGGSGVARVRELRRPRSDDATDPRPTTRAGARAQARLGDGVLGHERRHGRALRSGCRGARHGSHPARADRGRRHRPDLHAAGSHAGDADRARDRTAHPRAQRGPPAAPRRAPERSCSTSPPTRSDPILGCGAPIAFMRTRSGTLGSPTHSPTPSDSRAPTTRGAGRCPRWRRRLAANGSPTR